MPQAKSVYFVTTPTDIIIFPEVYYYHVITRKTQWDRPSEDDKDGDILMDLGTPEDNEVGVVISLN